MVLRYVIISQALSEGHRKIMAQTCKERHLEREGTVDVGQVLSVSTAHTPDDGLRTEAGVRVSSSQHLVHNGPGTRKTADRREETDTHE